MFRQRNISNKSTSSNRSTSSESIKTKYVKEMALPFLMDKMLNDTDAKYIILQRYYDTLRYQYELTTDLQKIIPFDNQQFTDNAVYLALNPRIYPFIPELIERIRHNPEKLKVFYHNLAKNKNPKVMPYLKTIYYEFDPESDKLNWINLSGNKNAIRILKREYKKYPNNLVWDALCKNPNAIKILEKEYVRVPNNLVWDALCENTKAYNILLEEYKIRELNWSILSGNVGVIRILNDKIKTGIVDDMFKTRNINWDILSGNTKAIKLIIYKINDERINPQGSIWRPKGLLKETDMYINWKRLSENPSIFTINGQPEIEKPLKEDKLEKQPEI
jgi:hypothetical protein